jgi:outer membrane protein insertion porin family
LIIFFFLLTSSSFSEIKKIKISGNSRVSSNTIELLVDKKINNVDLIYINNLTKKIYDTDFFYDVKISYNQDTLIIAVVENPIVNFFYIKGIDGNDLDTINKLISLKENSIFSSSKLKKDIENIKDYFRSVGYFLSIVDPDVIKLENNQVNLILNIEKKDITHIQNIYFIGNKYFNDSILIDVISSVEYSWWKIFSSSVLNEQRIEYDKQLLKEFYKSKGFYDVQIVSVIAGLNKNNNFTLTYSINSGNKYKFGIFDIKVDSAIYKNDDISFIKNFSNNFLSKQLYSQKTLSKLNKKIIDYLENKKYFNVDISLIETAESGDLINVLLQLNEEKKSFVSKINIEGNTITEEKTIRDNLAISEGDDYNLNKIKKSIDNLKSKQLFSKVEYQVKDSAVKNNKDLTILVIEQPTGNISAGVGYGTNGGTIQASINERNFLGQGINFNFTGTLATEKVLGEFVYSNPNFNNSDKEFTNTLFSEANDYKNSNYQNKKIGDKISTKYEIYENIFFRPNFLIQYDKLETNASSSALLKSRQGNSTTTSVGYNFLLDERDSRFYPTSGFLIYFDQNVATFISDIPTIQTSLGSTFYNEIINENFIGSAKFKIANVTSFNNKDSKLSDRLFNSATDIRGFDLRGIGPVDNLDHVGGNYLASLSFKSTFPNPITESLRPNSYAFYDMANIWGIDYSDSISSNYKFRSSLGVGLDIVSPFGPVSFSYAVPITKNSTDKEQRFLFNIGSSF